MSYVSNAGIFQRRILNTCLASTLIIAPNLGTDPINIIKLVTLFVGILLSMSVYLSPLFRLSKSLDKFTIMSCFCLALLSIFSFLMSKQSKFEQLWGAWGRSTGLLYYLCLLFLFVAGYHIASNFGVEKLTTGFSKLIIPFLAYGVLQVLGLDPIPWSRKEIKSKI